MRRLSQSTSSGGFSARDLGACRLSQSAVAQVKEAVSALRLLLCPFSRPPQPYRSPTRDCTGVAPRSCPFRKNTNLLLTCFSITEINVFITVYV